MFDGIRIGIEYIKLGLEVLSNEDERKNVGDRCLIKWERMLYIALMRSALSHV
jgi:hypothetical protein